MFALGLGCLRACQTAVKSIVPLSTTTTTTTLRALLHTTPPRLGPQNPLKVFTHDRRAFVKPHIPKVTSRPYPNTPTDRPFVYADDPFVPPTLPNAGNILQQYRRDMRCLMRNHTTLRLPPRGRVFPLVGKPQAKGVVLKTLIKKPKKPNSANRRCVRVRLSTGKEYIAHVPGEGHNLQEHSIVLVRNGRTQDLVGVKLKVIRGKYDCAPVKKRTE
ncbi:putative 28S ribosomal protein S12, mitochondrial [Hypsibius exemplaris]|uniref:Small ribosomal subunit protein uS12m n=1 Tax=Hypsibius exemplaris TaxID=2072580 RepID=A0A9X6N9S3_HYPEX|nr:putative 28S ribosomal protein S12, mitochondrial [Hypsibius exemplaris]